MITFSRKNLSGLFLAISSTIISVFSRFSRSMLRSESIFRHCELSLTMAFSESARAMVLRSDASKLSSSSVLPRHSDLSQLSVSRKQ